MQAALDPPRLIFVGTRRGNSFMNELLDAVAFEVAQLGVTVERALDRFPEAEGGVYVVIPHEFFATAPRSAHPDDAQLRRTIAFCVEQPGTPWFDLTVARARTAAAAVDINTLSVRELGRRGVAAQHFQIGYTKAWDRWGGSDTPRPVDVVHLGSEAPRRLQALSLYATDLWRYETRLLLPTVDPKTRDREDYLSGSGKWDLLARSKVVLNLHRQPLAYFEWVRVVEAMCNGCVVVSEGSRDSGPLVAGEHFLAGRLSSLGMLVDELLSDEPALDALRRSAYDMLRSSIRMAASAEQLVELAGDVAVGRRRRAATSRGRDAAFRIARGVRRRVRRHAAATEHQPSPFEHAIAAELRGIRTTQKRLALGQIELSRALQRLESGGADDPYEVARSAAYADARPRVSVMVPLYNHAHDVVRALESAACSTYEDAELIVLDDGSSDASRRVAGRFVESRREIPALLLAHRGNRGLGATRNALVEAARGELVLALDADNELYPPAIERLVAALDEHEDAFFAYPILEVHTNDVPIGLLGHKPWSAQRLRHGNYIDALSLMRRDVLRDLGGYSTDMRLYGWEDFDLWCRAASRGLRGAHVPQILARYASGAHSMLATTNIDDGEAFALLRRAYPDVFDPRPRRRGRA